MIIVVELGTGNIGSVLNMLKKAGIRATGSSNPSDIQKAKKLILPGVGAFDNAMKKLKELGLIDILYYQVIQNKIPILGICLGMQILCKSSEEGELPGLNYVNAKVLRFNNIDRNPQFKIPHMGWNTINLIYS